MSRVVYHAEQVSMAYPGTLALDHVDFDVYADQVNVLVGENGAGKSTLMKILAGIERPMAGRLLLEGEPISFSKPSEATSAGIGIIHQELDLCLNMTVAENIFLGQEIVNGVLVARAEQERLARQFLNQLKHDIEPNTIVGDLKVSEQQIIAIARAISQDIKVLIMDEPTSSLSASEVDVLFDVIRDLKNRNVAIIYISHRLEELLELGDHITVLRDGQVVAKEEMSHNINMAWILRNLLGNTKLDVTHHGGSALGDTILEVKDVSLPKTPTHAGVRHVSFEVKRGEIVGLFGLMGAGRTELLESLMGLNSQATGEVLLADHKLGWGLDVDRRIDLGMMLVPEDRQAAGIVQTMTLGENIRLASMGRYQRLGWLPPNYGSADVSEMMRSLAIKAYSPKQMITTLSGGNQQKAIIAKALLTEPQLLMMDDPGRGVDVKAKAEVFVIMNRLADQGIGILFVSSEVKEIIALSDRTLVMCDGKITAELVRGKYDENDLMRYATRAHKERPPEHGQEANARPL